MMTTAKQETKKTGAIVNSQQQLAIITVIAYA